MFNQEEEIRIVEYINSVQQWKMISNKIVGKIDYSKENEELNQIIQKYIHWLFSEKSSKSVPKNVIDLSLDIKDLTDYELFERFVLLKQMDISFYGSSFKNYKSEAYSKPSILKENSDSTLYLNYHSHMINCIKSMIGRKIMQ